MTTRTNIAIMVCIAALFSAPILAVPFSFSTGNPDGKIATASRQASAGKLETETADDFILSQTTSIDHARFIGLIPAGAQLSDIANVEIEFYHVFPADSADPPSGNVLTRDNSPADVEIGAAIRDGTAGDLTFAGSLLSSSFSVGNTVVNGINKQPNQKTGGEGPATGQEVAIDVTFTTPVLLPSDHYFFRPEVLLTNGDFLLLSASKPIVGGTGPFLPDLQSWTRNTDLKPDWSRIGTDIIGAAGGVAPTFNAAFSLSGQTVQAVPTGSTAWLLALGAFAMSLVQRARPRR
jgi:hypothetical protein